MKLNYLSHTGLSKFLAGETFNLTIKPEDTGYEFELYTNANRTSQSYPFKFHHDQLTCHLKLTHTGFFKWQLRYKARDDKKWKWLRLDNDRKLTGHLQVDPRWLGSSIVYNVFVRFFKGKVARWNQRVLPGEGGTFDDVKLHLNELKKLNVTTLYFNPIHMIGELYRKYNMLDELPAYLQPGSPYSIKDYKSIDPELTYDRDTKKHLLSDPQQEFKDLINAAHEKGMYVILDLVFNHTAHDFVFQRIRPEWYLYKENITSLQDPYLYPEELDQGKPWGDPRHTVAPYDHGVWWEDAAQLNWEYKIPEGPNPPPKNSSLKEMWEYFKSIPKYWVSHFGIDGFRCDIAYRVPPDFWKACIAETREMAQKLGNNLAGDVVFIAEAYTDDLALLQNAGFSAVYGDYSNKLARPLDIKGYLDYMYNLSSNHFPSGSRWFIFPEAHDFERTPRKVLGDQASESTPALLANQSRWLLTATLPGTPLIFNGFEKIEWQPVNLFSYGAVDWERDSDLRNFISKINRIRHWYPALQSGSYTYLSTNQNLDENTQLFSFLREKGDQRIIIVVNMDVHRHAGPALVFLPEAFDRSNTLTDLLTDQIYKRGGRQLLVQLPPGGAHIFKVE